MHILLSNRQAEPGRTVKQEQEEISRNHVQTFTLYSLATDRLVSDAEEENLSFIFHFFRCFPFTRQKGREGEPGPEGEIAPL